MGGICSGNRKENVGYGKSPAPQPQPCYDYIVRGNFIPQQNGDLKVHEEQSAIYGSNRSNCRASTARAIWATSWFRRLDFGDSVTCHQRWCGPLTHRWTNIRAPSHMIHMIWAYLTELWTGWFSKNYWQKCRWCLAQSWTAIKFTYQVNDL